MKLVPSARWVAALMMLGCHIAAASVCVLSGVHLQIHAVENNHSGLICVFTNAFSTAILLSLGVSPKKIYAVRQPIHFL